MSFSLICWDVFFVDKLEAVSIGLVDDWISVFGCLDIGIAPWIMGSVSPTVITFTGSVIWLMHRLIVL